MVDTTLRGIDAASGRSLGSGSMSVHEPDGPGRRRTWQERYDEGGRTSPDHRGMWREFDNSWVMVSELVGATLTWGAIGWLADRWLGLTPLLMSIGFVLGFATGFYLLWARTTGHIPRPGATPDPHDPDEGPAA